MRADIYEFFKHSQNDGRQAYPIQSEYYIVPEPPNGNVCRFSFETDNTCYFMPLMLGALKWGISVPITHLAICEPNRIRKVVLESVVTGYVLREDNADYGIDATDISKDTSINEARHLGGQGEWMLVVRERRMLSITGEIGTLHEEVTTMREFSFVTECLWYPPLRNKRVVKYLRSALQGAIGKISDPLHIVQLMVKCEVAAPRLREVLFAKSDDVGVQK